MGDHGLECAFVLCRTIYALGVALFRIVVWVATLVVMVVLGGIGFVVMLLAVYLFAGPQMPSDKAMLNHYEQHKTEFARLGELLYGEVELSSVTPSTGQWVTQERQVLESGDNARCDQYIDLFNKIELNEARVGGHGGDSVDDTYYPRAFSVYSKGMLPGISKGYVYAPDATKLFGVIQSDTKYHDQSGIRYVSLGDGWYIFLD